MFLDNSLLPTLEMDLKFIILPGSNSALLDISLSVSSLATSEENIGDHAFTGS